MSEIPKDGLSYLCWHKYTGHVFLHWDSDLKYYVTHFRGGWYSSTEGFIRWMDEMGVWHEIEK